MQSKLTSVSLSVSTNWTKTKMYWIRDYSYRSNWMSMLNSMHLATNDPFLQEFLLKNFLQMFQNFKLMINRNQTQSQAKCTTNDFDVFTVGLLRINYPDEVRCKMFYVMLAQSNWIFIYSDCVRVWRILFGCLWMAFYTTSNQFWFRVWHFFVKYVCISYASIILHILTTRVKTIKATRVWCGNESAYLTTQKQVLFVKSSFQNNHRIPFQPIKRIKMKQLVPYRSFDEPIYDFLLKPIAIGFKQKSFKFKHGSCKYRMISSHHALQCICDISCISHIMRANVVVVLLFWMVLLLF